MSAATPLDHGRLTGSGCDTCGSGHTEIRRKRAANGAEMFAYQCMTCGTTVSAWLKKSALPSGSIPDWDDALRERYWREHAAEWRQQRVSEYQQKTRGDRDRWLAEHTAYLRTPKWRSLRSRVLERSGGRCEGCRDNDATQVHHLTYRHWQDELLFELVALCDDCHRRAHDRADDDQWGR